MRQNHGAEGALQLRGLVETMLRHGGKRARRLPRGRGGGLWRGRVHQFGFPPSIAIADGLPAFSRVYQSSVVKLYICNP